MAAKRTYVGVKSYWYIREQWIEKNISLSLTTEFAVFVLFIHDIYTTYKENDEAVYL